MFEFGFIKKIKVRRRLRKIEKAIGLTLSPEQRKIVLDPEFPQRLMVLGRGTGKTVTALVWALMWIRVTGPGAACGVITQSVCSIGMISKMYITAIEDLDTRILESLDAMGCTPFQKIRYGVIPQLTASFISTTIYRFDINLKDATTLGIVGAGGIGASLVQCLNSRRWAMVGSFVWGLMILVLIIEFLSTQVRSKLARGE